MPNSIVMRIGIAFALVSLAVLPPVSVAHAADAPWCFGKRATVVGTAGDDELLGTRAADVIVGLGGRDTIRGKGGADRICAGPGGDYQNDQGLNDLDWEITYGGAGADLIAGGPGPDQIFGGPEDDRIYLGAGGLDDTVSVDNDAKGGPGNDLVIGTSGSDHFVDGGGNDRMAGRGGYDYFVAGRGRDRLLGGRGRDHVSYTGRKGPIRVDLARDRVDKGDALDVVRSISDLDATEADDVVLGNADANLFYGGGGNDDVRGRGGSDCLAGANGNNTLNGGKGFDFYAQSSLDCLNLPMPGSALFWPTGSINVDLEEGRAWRVGEESSLTAIEGVYGTFVADMIFGDAGDNKLYGGPGRDEVHGRDGTDFLDGGQGSDALDGGLGTDTCVNGEAVALCE